MNAPAWLPDWRSDSGYPAAKSWLAWRWEFLRRRADFQAAWLKAEKQYRTTWRKEPALVRDLTKHKPVTEDPSVIGEWARAVFRADERLFIKSGNAKLFQKFGLTRALNPAKDYSDDELDTAFDRPDFGEVLELRAGEVTKHYRRGVVLIAFDLRWNLQQQLRDAKQILVGERQSLGVTPAVERAHTRNLWPQYLRALDAKVVGATNSDIARVLLGGDPRPVRDLLPKVHEVLRAAKQLQNRLTA